MIKQASPVFAFKAAESGAAEVLARVVSSGSPTIAQLLNAKDPRECRELFRAAGASKRAADKYASKFWEVRAGVASVNEDDAEAAQVVDGMLAYLQDMARAYP